MYGKMGPFYYITTKWSFLFENHMSMRPRMMSTSIMEKNGFEPFLNSDGVWMYISTRNMHFLNEFSFLKFPHAL